MWRKVQDHPFYKQRRKFSKFEAWIDILMEAQHSEDGKQVIFGNDVLVCSYGESLKSLRTWASRWRWPESNVRRFLDLLEKMNQIRRKSEGKTTRITVLNYSRYDPKRRKPDANLTQPRRKPDATAVTDKNVKNVTMKEYIPPISPKKQKRKQTKFVPPTVEEVETYFFENGYKKESGKKAWNYYEAGEPPWHDSRGNPVKAWKQKMCAVWFKKENKINGEGEFTGKVYEGTPEDQIYWLND